MKYLKSALVAVIAAVAASGVRAATLVEDFESNFPAWESGWLGTNSNLQNYYGVGGGRGNNPDGLWVGSNTITFDNAFGTSITSLSLDIASYVNTNFLVWDSFGSVIYNSGVTLTNGAFTDPGAYDSHSVSSNNGIGAFGFSSFVVGNLGIDNVVVTTGTSVPDGGPTVLLLGATMLGLLIARRKRAV